MSCSASFSINGDVSEFEHMISFSLCSDLSHSLCSSCCQLLAKDMLCKVSDISIVGFDKNSSWRIK